MREIFLNSRILFVVEHCPYCKIWKQFVERINISLKIEKRISVIDCTAYHEYGIVEDERILLFMQYINGSYPVLFIDGRRKDGTNSRTEAEAWLRSKLFDDFEIPQKNKWLAKIKSYERFEKECEIIQRGIFKKKIICN